MSKRKKQRVPQQPKERKPSAREKAQLGNQVARRRWH